MSIRDGVKNVIRRLTRVSRNPGGPDYALDVIHRLTSADAQVRDDAAEEVSQFASTYRDPREIFGAASPVVAAVLAAVRIAETDKKWAQEAQLNALCELHGWNLVPPLALEILEKLDRAQLTDEQVEYLEYLFGPP